MKKRTVKKWLMTAVCLLSVSLFADSPLYKAAEKGNVAEVKRLLKRGANVESVGVSREPALVAASFLEKREIVEMLLNHGANIEAKDGNENTSLQRVAWRNLEIVKLLLDRGAQVNTKNVHGTTPLHQAANRGQTAIVDLLLDHGADINAERSFNGDTPLHWSVASRWGRIETVKLLIDGGADIDAKNKDGDTPLDDAVRNGKLEAVSLIQTAKREQEQKAKRANQERMKADKQQAVKKVGGMSLKELVAEQPLKTKAFVLAISDALLEAEEEKLPSYLLQNLDAAGKLRTAVKKRWRDAQMEVTKCKNKAQDLKEAGKNEEASKLVDLSVAIQGYQASLMSIKSALENY